MKARNHIVYADSDTLTRLADEYRYIGRDCKVYEDRLVVFALPARKQKKVKSREQQQDDKPERWTKRERYYGKEE